jgi:hypothetical protein
MKFVENNVFLMWKLTKQNSVMFFIFPWNIKNEVTEQLVDVKFGCEFLVAI